MAFCTASKDGVLIRVHVVPRASKTEVVGLQGEALKVRLQAPPVDGKANAALCEFIAGELGVPKRSASVVAGMTSREKTVLVAGLADASAVEKIFAV